MVASTVRRISVDIDMMTLQFFFPATFFDYLSNPSAANAFKRGNMAEIPID